MNKNFYLCIVRKKIFYNNIPSINLRQRDLSEWIHECVEGRGAKVKRLSINFIKEGEMLDLNRKHLNHDNTQTSLHFVIRIINYRVRNFISFKPAKTPKPIRKQLKMRFLDLFHTGFFTILA